MNPSTSNNPDPNRLPILNKAPLARKRVARACDECRLHKAKCNAADPCETCTRYDRVCSYNVLPAKSRGPTAKITLLEARLAKARDCISKLQDQLPDADTVEADRTITSSLASKSTKGPSSKSATYNTSIYYSPTASIFQAGPGCSLIESLLLPLSSTHQLPSSTASALAHSVLYQTAPARDSAPPLNPSRQLPIYDFMIAIVFAAFSNIFGLANVIVEHEFRLSAQRLYDQEPHSYTDEDISFIPLFHSVMALGAISSTRLDLPEGQEQLFEQSVAYIEHASASIDRDQICATPLNLQVALCVVLYLVDTSKLDHAQNVLRSACASPIVEEMFAKASSLSLNTPSPQDLRTRNLIWAIHYLDMHIAATVGSSTLLPHPGPELATVHTVNMATHNVAKYRRSDNTFLASVALAMAVELLKLIGRIKSSRSSFDETHGNTLPQPDATKWNNLTAEFETWEVILKNVFAEDESTYTLTMIRHHLQCQLFIAQISLYHPFLHRHCEPVQMESPSDIDNIIRGQTCTKIATSAIAYITRHLEQSQAACLPFNSAYLLFVSLVTLVIATAFTDVAHRQMFQHSIQLATAALSASSFGRPQTKLIFLEFARGLLAGLDRMSLIGLEQRLTSLDTRSASIPFSSSSTNQSPRDLSQNAYRSDSVIRASFSSTRLSKDDDSPDVWGFDPS